MKFLHRLRLEIDRYYLAEAERVSNYEDLYYVASQVRDSESQEYDNPVVQAFIDQLLPDIEPLLTGQDEDYQRPWQIGELAREAAHYLRCVVWHLLSKEPIRLDHLASIKEACCDTEVSGLEIFTVNHDTLLERSLSENEIEVTDGFGAPDPGVRYWNPDLFGQNRAKVRLYKLHGSVNWFRLRPERGSWADESIGIPTEWDFWHTRSPQGQGQWPVDGHPEFLIGTFNKMLDYNRRIYMDLHCEFYRSLSGVRRLIVSGYGFGDKGINTRICEWIYSAPAKRVIVVEPEPARVRVVARGAISDKWDEWVAEGKLLIRALNV